MIWESAQNDPVTQPGNTPGGEVLKQFDGRGGDQRTESKNDGTVNFAPTLKQIADEAGMSERQRVTAVRIANIPEPEFNCQTRRDAGFSERRCG